MLKNKNQNFDAWNYIKASDAPTETERVQLMLLLSLFKPLIFVKVRSGVFSDCCFMFDVKLN